MKALQTAIQQDEQKLAKSQQHFATVEARAGEMENRHTKAASGFAQLTNRLAQARKDNADAETRLDSSKAALQRADGDLASAQKRFAETQTSQNQLAGEQRNWRRRCRFDKVIDRANVLRFGAPKELKASPAPTVAPTADFLPRATWEQWVKPFEGNGFDNERTALTQLNQMLESVNRPFGHRVYRAILDYLANYPGALTDAARCRNALADQIEQKIIPKLRGLDTQDDTTSRCLDQLGAMISGLQDPELADAFTRARQQHLFEWFGVKRS